MPVQCGAKSGARAVESANLTTADPALERLLELWPSLREVDRNLVLRYVEQLSQTSGS